MAGLPRAAVSVVYCRATGLTNGSANGGAGHTRGENRDSFEGLTAVGYRWPLADSSLQVVWVEEAFQAALDRIARRHASPHLDSRNIQVVAGARFKSRGSPMSISPPALAKLVYAARKLGRQWSSYTNPGGDSLERLGRLQDDWTVLAVALANIPTDQQVDVLDGFVQGLDFGDRQGLERKRRYVDRQRMRFPEQFAGFAAIPSVTSTTRTAFVVHALEELDGSPLDERHRLHAVLAQAAPTDVRTEPKWLYETLGRWIGSGCQWSAEPAPTS